MTVCVFVLVFAVAIIAQTPAKQKSGSVEQELLKLEQEWSDALVKRDLAFLDRIMAEDCMFTGPEGVVLTKAQMLGMLKSGEDVISSMVTDDMKARVYGDAAVVTGRNTTKETLKEKDISGLYRWTDTWIKKAGRWQCVATHISKIAQTSDHTGTYTLVTINGNKLPYTPTMRRARRRFSRAPSHSIPTGPSPVP